MARDIGRRERWLRDLQGAAYCSLGALTIIAPPGDAWELQTAGAVMVLVGVVILVRQALHDRVL